MSDTPRTDKELIDTYDYGYVVPADFARELEREADRNARMVEVLQKCIAQLQVDLEQRDKDYENLQALM